MTEDISAALPVFSTEFEVRLWKMIKMAESAGTPEHREKIRADIMSRFDNFKGTLASPILCHLVDLACGSESESWERDVGLLVSFQRPRDCHPALEAASVMASKGLLNSAQSYLDMVMENQDVAACCRTRAKVLMEGGKTRDATQNLWRSLRSDPLVKEPYTILQKLNPDRNWMAYYALELLFARGILDPPPASPTGPETELYKIYCQWDAETKDLEAGVRTSGNAIERLRNTEEFVRSDPDYILADARFSLAAGDVKYAWTQFDRVAEMLSNDVTVLCESAAARLEGDSPNPQEAVVIYRNAESLDPGNPEVHKGLITAYRAMGKDDEAASVARSFLDSENAGKEDYERAAYLFFDTGNVGDARDAARRLLLTYEDNVKANIILSKISSVQGDLDSSINYAYAAVRCGRKSPESLVCLADALLSKRRTASAIRRAKKALDKDPRNIPALLCLADCYTAQGRHQLSEDVCRKILDIDPENEGARDRIDEYTIGKIEKGHIPDESSPEAEIDPILILRGHLTNGEFAEAADLIAKNDTTYRSDPDYNRMKGNVEYALGEYTKASASFASAAVDNPDSAAVWHSKGLADEKSGDLSSALESFDKAVLLDFSNPRMWVSRGCILERIGDDAGAVDSYNRAIELDPSAPFPLIRKALILASHGHHDEALAFVDIAKSIDSDDRTVEKLRMRICLAAKRYEDVLSTAESMKGTEPDSETVPFAVRAHMGLGEIQEAKSMLDSALAEFPESRELLLAARDLYSKINDVPSLMDTCHKLISLRQDDRESMRLLADSLQRTHRADEARQIYDEIEKLDRTKPRSRTDPASAYSVAQSLLQLGDIAGASRKIDEILASEPDNEDYILFRSKVFLQAGDSDSAENVLAGFINRNPDSVPVLEAYGDLKSSKQLWSDALDSYGRCLNIISDRGNPVFRSHILSKMGSMKVKLGDNASAADLYTEAVDLNPDDTEAAQALTALHLLAGDNRKALEVITDSLERSENATSYSILMQVYQALGETDMVRSAYTQFRFFDNPSDADELRVMRTLNDAGLSDEAVDLKRSSEQARKSSSGSADVDSSVKRCAERLMRRAYMQGRKIDDPEIRDVGDSDSGLAAKAIAYLRDIPTYDVIIPGTHDFDRMETLSYNIVAVPRSPGLELLTPETAYIAGHARDADEAKKLVAYVRSAKTSPIGKIPDGIMRFVDAYPSSEVPLETIMLNSRCGIMTARIIQSCIDKAANIEGSP